MRMKIAVLILLLTGCMAMTSVNGSDNAGIEFAMLDAAGEPAREFRQGETVRLVFCVKNTSTKPLRLAYTFPPHDVAVLPSKHEAPAWQAWSGKMFPQVMRTEPLPPGGSLEFFIEWNLDSNNGAPLPAGAYRVQPRFAAFVQPGNRRLAPELRPLEITIIE